MTTTYPKPGDPVSAFTRADSTSEGHDADHGRVIGMWENVKHHGANGTYAASVDDGPAINRAISQFTSDNGFTTAPGTVYIPPGLYRIRTPITINSGVTLQGAGLGSILLNECGASAMIQITGSNNTLKDFHCHGTSAYNLGCTGSAVSIVGPNGTGVTRNTISRVEFRYQEGLSTWVIDTSWALETLIQNCSILGAQGGGIRFGDTSNASIIRDCTLSNNGVGALGGIDLGSNGALVEGNVIEAWRGSYGLRMGGGSHVLIRNWFEDDNAASKYIHILPESTDSSLIGNNCSGGGIYIDQAKRIYVAQNQINGGPLTLVSNAAANKQTSVTLVANFFPGGIVTTGLANTLDEIVRIGGDAYATAPNGVNIQIGHVRGGPASVIGWTPTTASDAEVDTWMSRSAAKVIALGTDNAIKPSTYAHGSLPSPASYAAPAMVYCSTDKKPVWSDGSTHWVDAAGANHT